MLKSTLLDKVNYPSDLRKLKKEDLNQLAKELREELVNVVSTTGGHLGAGLGVVELTVALHYVFDTPKDKLVWDVGHQSYPHKIITGRRASIRTLRKGGGLSGFTKRAESEYDPFGAAHSSTSISSALGIAVANKLSNKSDNVIAVIGDGAMRSYLAKILSGKMYFSLRETFKLIISAFSKRFSKKAGKAEDFLRSAVTGGTLFNSMGFYYIGPIDGHDMDSLVSVLKNVKEVNYNGPVLVHLKTEKGKGYKFAERSEDKYHGVSKFNVNTGIQEKTKSNTPSYTKVFSNTLIKHAEKDSKIIGITAAMP